MTEIQGKSILVRVSARLDKFELARVRVIESQLYLNEITVNVLSQLLAQRISYFNRLNSPRTWRG